jgi:hypothetical protein
MTGVERNVLSVLALNREVDNGGFDQFFSNCSRRFALVIVADLVRIGCVEIADITQRALDALNLPELTVASIETAMKTENTERTRALNPCDTAFYNTGGKRNLVVSIRVCRLDFSILSTFSARHGADPIRPG